jgi:hypothetical protein
VGCRVWITALAAAALLCSVVPAGASPQPLPVSPYYLGRGDPRLCPSPQCGGLFIHLVNRSRTICGDGLRRPACYVAAADLGRLGVSDARRSALMGSISAGRALVRGVLVRGRVPGFPQLDTLVVTEVWLASRSPQAPTGTFRRLHDNGVRCIAAPCFSTDALTLNPRRASSRATVSQVDLSRTGASPGAQRRALTLVARGDLIAAGTIVAVPNAGPAGTGRALVASQLYTRAA